MGHFSTSRLPITIIVALIIGFKLFSYDVPYNSENFPKVQEVTRTSLKDLSKWFQESLQDLQRTNSSSCNSSRVINCGLNSACGLGCQIHYRMMCIILSNALQVPFVNYFQNWPYEDAWDPFLEPVGSNCSVNNDILAWNDDSTFTIKDVLKRGLPIPEFAAVKLTQHFPNQEEAVYWVLGQYIKFSFQLNSNAQVKISHWRNQLNFSHNRLSSRNPVIGMHIRKTDKVLETDVMPTLEDFMEEAQNYRNYLITKNITFNQINIFIASEDHTVLTKFQNKFASKEWNIVGFPVERTYATQPDRKSQLWQILRDITILAESDFVVCTLSSNVCRLIFEMQSYQSGEEEEEKEGIISNRIKKIKSLDGGYYVHTYSNGIIMPLKFIYL